MKQEGLKGNLIDIQYPMNLIYLVQQIFNHRTFHMLDLLFYQIFAHWRHISAHYRKFRLFLNTPFVSRTGTCFSKLMSTFVNIQGFYSLSKTPNRHGTQIHSKWWLSFDPNSHRDLIGDQNDVQYV